MDFVSGSESEEDVRPSRRRTRDERSSDDEEVRSRSRSRKDRKHKKHKKEKKSKKKKRRRRSRTPTPVKDQDQASTDREGGSTPEIEAGEVVDLTDQEDAEESDHQEETPARKKIDVVVPSSKKKEEQPSFSSSSGSVQSMSIEESNKLRAQLGMAPLKISGGGGGGPNSNANSHHEDANDNKLEGSMIPNSTERHKPPINLSEKSATEKMRERLKQRRLKRQQENKLLSVATLGSERESDDPTKWVEKQKKKLREKKEAEKRAKMLEQLDDEFGVGQLVQEDREKDRVNQYGKASLEGLKVEHSADKFKDGQTVVLTLKDADILDNDNNTDTLVNVNMVDDERTLKNLENIKKGKVGYNAYDNEQVDDFTGELKRKNMLDKYDEEIDGHTKDSFQIGTDGGYNDQVERERERQKIRQKLLSKKNVESLQMPALRVASDYYTQEETKTSQVKFKKPKKKKRKVKRKMLKADDLIGLEDNKPKNTSESVTLPMDVDEKKVDDDEDDDYSSVKVDEDDDCELQNALSKARRLKQRVKVEDVGDKILETLKVEKEDSSLTSGAEFINTFSDDQPSNNIILNETSEFCRHLGAWRSHEASGLGGEGVSRDILEFESSLTDNQRRSEAAKVGKSERGQWEEVDDDDEDVEMSDHVQPVKKERKLKSTTILDEEPDLASGMAAAIKLAHNKGYWETGEQAVKGSNLKHLMAKNYTIDDKVGGGADDRHSRGRDRYSGPSQPFQEKSGYVPNIKLDYIDDSGRLLCQKEAFRYLSHKFHGKGSGKIKTEKRMKKIMEESMMKNMSSTDTPLSTLEKLRERQKESATPYVVLSGNKISNAADLKK